MGKLYEEHIIEANLLDRTQKQYLDILCVVSMFVEPLPTHSLIMLNIAINSKFDQVDCYVQAVAIKPTC